LTNVAISFGVPCALVNCITIDAQLWGEAVRFVSKRVRLRGEGGRLLKQRETTSTPWRWRVFSAESIARHNAVAENNEGDDILETVKEVECLARGVPEKYERGFENPERLLERWRASLGLPYFYGNARPGLYCLRKFEDEFLD
jgi:putative glycosyltransferase (TIGR04372 family)